MPTAYTITFRTLRAHRPAGALAPTLQDVHGLACRLLEPPESPGHHNQRKPFSARLPRPSDTSPEELDLRLGQLCPGDGMPAPLAAALGQRYRLGAVELEALAVRKDAGSSYVELRRLGPLWACEYRFLSPTYFARSGRDYPLPDPQLIVRSLVERWNTHSPDSDEVRVGEDLARELGSRIVLAAHAIRTRAVPSGNGRPRIGFVGTARLGLRTPDRRDQAGIASARLLATLSAFAPYSGVGAQTTHGLGAVTTTRLAS